MICEIGNGKDNHLNWKLRDPCLCSFLIRWLLFQW